MKKILIVTGSIALALIAIIFTAEALIYAKFGNIVKDYDKTVEKQISAGDWQRAYYSLNQMHNRFAEVSGGHKLLDERQLKWIDQRLSRRRDDLLAGLAENLPGGVAGDWTTIAELENRYQRFYRDRIFMLNRDEGRRKQVRLISELRGTTSQKRIVRLPECSQADIIAANQERRRTHGQKQ